MNPKDPQESSLSTLIPYPVHVNSNGTRGFATEGGITYQLAFNSGAESFPASPFAEDLVIFAIVALNGYTRKVAFADRGDPRIELTIMRELQTLFDVNPFLVIAYSCDTDNNLERHRSIVFGRWYRKYLAPNGVARLKYAYPGQRAYGAVLYHESNPYREQIEKEFNWEFSGK